MKKQEFKEGIINGLPICFGYLSVSFAFGMMAKANGLPTWIAVLISMSNVTSAGQLAGLNMIVAQGAYLEIALTTLIINLRYSLMSLSLSQKMPDDISQAQRMMISFGITDEIFAVAIERKSKFTPSYFAGLILIPYVGWAVGTFLGAAATQLMTPAIASALGIAIYGMFIAIIIPPCVEVKAIRYVLCWSISLSFLFRYLPLLNRLSSGWAIIIITLIASFLTALKYPVEVEHHE